MSRQNIKLDENDHYFLNTNKAFRREQFVADGEYPDDVWGMILDFFFRLSVDYTAASNNKKMDDKKRNYRMRMITNNAEAFKAAMGLRLA